MKGLCSLFLMPLLAAAFGASAQQAAAQPIKLQPRSGEPLYGLSADELLMFESGQRIFKKNFIPAEGLGPVFNNTSCGNCHGQGNPGALPATGGTSIGLTQSVFRFGRVRNGKFDPLNSLGGSLLQIQSINSQLCSEQIPQEATAVSRRIVTPIFGAGLVEAIPDRTILLALGNPAVSGVVNLVRPLEEPGRLSVGRFGWKSQSSTLLSFTADALRNELGITNELLPDENAPQGNLTALAACDQVADPESALIAGDPILNSLTQYQRWLAPPPQTPKFGMGGEGIFKQVGCADCHTPSLKIGSDARLPTVLWGEEIKPYSDFLLHNMGLAADGIAQGGADLFEMRTAPLWGIRSRSFLWHDGSVPALNDVAVLDTVILGSPYAIPEFFGHNAVSSDSANSAHAYSLLNQSDRSKLLSFLRSLGRPEFDLGGDNLRVDHNDIPIMRSCLQVGHASPDDICAPADLDGNGVVEQFDLSGFVAAYQDPQFDCNCDGANDLTQIFSGQLSDANGDGFPDVCKVQLTLSLSKAWPADPWEDLQRDEAVNVVVTGASLQDRVYLFYSFSDGSGATTGVLPPPYSGKCVNLPGAENFAAYLNGAITLTPNAYGTASLSDVLPHSAGSIVTVQAFSVGPNGYKRSAPVTKRIL